MKLKYLLPFVFFTLTISHLDAQGTAYTIKGGLTLGVQKWDSYDQGPLFKYHGAISAESLDETSLFSVFAQAGYHIKGSALRGQRNLIDQFNNPFSLPTQEFLFRNISLILGAKRKYEISDLMKSYYLFGLRGDYTLGTNLDKYEEYNSLNGLFYPIDGFVRKWNYGVTVGGGFEFELGEVIGALLEITINPDFSYQYRQEAGSINVWNPYYRRSEPNRKNYIRNTTIEITAGFRLLRIVEYVD